MSVVLLCRMSKTKWDSCSWVPMMRALHGTWLATRVERPLERRLIELDLAHILRDLCEAFGIEHGERLLPDLRKGRPIRDGRIEEQIQHLPRSLEIPGRLCHGLRGRDLGRDLGLLLVIVDQMDEGLDQVVVDLAEAMRGKTQQIQADC